MRKLEEDRRKDNYDEDADRDRDGAGGHALPPQLAVHLGHLNKRCHKKETTSLNKSIRNNEFRVHRPSPGPSGAAWGGTSAWRTSRTSSADPGNKQVKQIFHRSRGINKSVKDKSKI